MEKTTHAHESEAKNSNGHPPTHSQTRQHSSHGSCGGCGACRKITSSTNASASLMLKSLDPGKKVCATRFLQRTHGNQYVQRLVQTKKDSPCLQRCGSRAIQMKSSGCCGGCANGKEEEGVQMQAKLTIGRPGDKYEQEANRVSEQVMRMPEPQIRRQPEEEEEEELQMKSLSEQITPLVQRQPMEEEEEEMQMQAKPVAGQISPLVQKQPMEEEEEELQAKEVSGSTPDVTPNLETSLNALRGGGQSLPKSDRTFFEQRLGHSFSPVRVHTDTRAADMARAVNARAFTMGRNIVFGSGQYQPTTPAGKKLMAHELTHVVQQSGYGTIGIQRVPCTTEERDNTRDMAESARTTGLAWVGRSRTALDRLHSRWINHKADFLAGRRTLRGEAVCAFDSNFNINQRNPDYGLRHIGVMFRLRRLEGRMGEAVDYDCQPDDDPICSTSPDGETQAYVINNEPPIHFCEPFRTDFDLLTRRSTVIHEYAHFLSGIGDEGGYAMPSSSSRTCSTGVKFSASSDVLVRTADALTGFVMHIGEVTEDESEEE